MQLIRVGMEKEFREAYELLHEAYYLLEIELSKNNEFLKKMEAFLTNNSDLVTKHSISGGF